MHEGHVWLERGLLPASESMTQPFRKRCTVDPRLPTDTGQQLVGLPRTIALSRTPQCHISADHSAVCSGPPEAAPPMRDLKHAA